LAWEAAQQLPPGEGVVPDRLLLTAAGLLAVVRVVDREADRSDPHLWHSTNGRSWSELTSPTWQAIWTGEPYLIDVTSGQAGMVALAGGPTGALALFSADGGQSWQATTLATGSGAAARSVVATERGFVAVGVVDGEWDPVLHRILGGRSAAWTSIDGTTWQPAVVAPASGTERLTFTAIYAAADGLLAGAADTSGGVPGAAGQIWISDAGSRWEWLGAPGDAVPYGSLNADGARMLILDDGFSHFDPNNASPWPGFRSGWTSLDGRTWTPVSFTGQLMAEQSFNGWWLTRDGLVLSGTNQVWLARPD
jgi:hypothetical protein